MTLDLHHPINILELKAVCLALLTFSKKVYNADILVQTDNMATKAYFNHQGGIRFKDVMEETIFLFQWAEAHLQSIKAGHLPGLDNLEADGLNRRDIIEEEWGLHPEVFNMLVRRFGQPELDLFTSRKNTKMTIFFSRAQGTNAVHIP